MADDRWWRGFDVVVLERVAPGARVLDAGCGDGGFVDRLRARGLDAWGVDPRAPAHPYLISKLVEDVDSIGKFDAVCAVMALHHVDLDRVFGAIRRLLRPNGWLLAYELAWEAYDERAAAWLASHDSSDADNSVEGWRREHGDLQTSEVVRSAFADAVDLTDERERPYLARMLGVHTLEAEEGALIAAGALPALGRWYFGRARLD
jgi:SAM-dependent methyltransferase